MSGAGLITKTLLTKIADAIREKTTESGTMTPKEMPDKIASIEAGGGGSDPVVTLDIGTSISVPETHESIVTLDIGTSITVPDPEDNAVPSEVYKSTSNSSSSSSFTLSVNCITGSLAVLVVADRCNMATPEGWDLLYRSSKSNKEYATISNEADGTTECYLTVFTKRILDTSTTTVTATVTGDGSNYQYATLFTLKYGKTLTIKDGSGGAYNDSGLSSEITAPAGDSLLLACTVWANSSYYLSTTPSPSTAITAVRTCASLYSLDAEQTVQVKNQMSNPAGYSYQYLLLGLS